MKRLYRFVSDCHRNSILSELFITDDRDVSSIIEKSVYFGEVLGKYSEIIGTIGFEEIIEVSVDQDRVSKLESVFGGPNLSGYNPFNYLSE